MKYIHITNNPEFAKYISEKGVNRIMIDLEKIGKNERQGHLDTVISDHKLIDIKLVKKNIHNTGSEIITRINPVHQNTKHEIEQAINFGTDYIMLPMFNSKSEVETVIKHINKKVKLILLFETPKSILNIDQIIELDQINEAHVGINDLSIAFDLKFMFELFSSSILEFITQKFKKRKIPFGIGGISRIGTGILDPKLILSEHVRLGSSRVIVSRSFTQKFQSKEKLILHMDFGKEISLISLEYERLKKLDNKWLMINKEKLINSLRLIAGEK